MEKNREHGKKRLMLCRGTGRITNLLVVDALCGYSTPGESGGLSKWEITPITHIVTPVVLIINLLTNPP